ncbi:hypothetical protein ACLOJK_008528 [Asimina triloba]
MYVRRFRCLQPLSVAVRSCGVNAKYSIEAIFKKSKINEERKKRAIVLDIPQPRCQSLTKWFYDLPHTLFDDEHPLHDAKGMIITPLHRSSVLLIIPSNTVYLPNGSSSAALTSRRLRSGAHPSISFTPSPVTREDHSSRGPDRSSSTMSSRYRSSLDDDDEEERVEKRSKVFLRSADEVTRYTSNASFKKNADMQRSRTPKSRLMHPVPPPSPYPPQDEISKSEKLKSGMLKSGMLKSGLLGTEEDNDDPFFDEDIPDRFSKEHLEERNGRTYLITILIFFICSILIPYLKRKEKWEVLILVLICDRLVSNWVIKIVVFFIKRNFLLHRRILCFIYSVRSSIQRVLWLNMVSIA